MTTDLRILELFSGIGGMHYAFQYSKLPGTVVAAFDINTVANSVYAYNHPGTMLKNNNIQILNAKDIEKLKVNTLLMSPPCQPHTRIGKKLDIKDNRSDAFQHLCTIIPECTSLRYILMENVKGFENSQAREIFITALESAGFDYCELILSPTCFGVPNTRHRYYCLARKDRRFPFATDHILEEMPSAEVPKTFINLNLSDILESDSSVTDEFLVSDKDLLKRVLLMDIVTADATNTMCFTKAYTHYAEGTGSVFTPLHLSEVNNIFKELKTIEDDLKDSIDDTKKLQLLRKLHLRYFTPREVARLMNFPESFDFPAVVTTRQKFRVLGNSINVLVVGELIKLLSK